MQKRTAVLYGATGLIGKQLVRYLLESPEYSRVTAVVRRPLHLRHPNLQEVVADFDQLEKYSDLMAGDDIFCCLGTTMRKAKTKEAFRRVDFDYPLQIARIAKRNGAQKFLLVSAIGANKHSPFFYNRVKGELEEKLAEIGFPQLLIFRPSLLLGDRKEFRLGEKSAILLSSVLSLFLIGPLQKYRAIDAEQVAYAMYRSAVKEWSQAIIVLESDQMLTSLPACHQSGGFSD
ncbi:oxidoreductase [Brevibacillus sp. H7]|uniref:oxidoreductase n=1 Tax=Brevibacillus sp. H7 TaxID=3349138 RepID=UPI0038235245